MGPKMVMKCVQLKARKKGSENRQLLYRLPHVICNINIHGPNIIGYSTSSWPHNQILFLCLNCSNKKRSSISRFEPVCCYKLY